eukprot:m.146739 g.146739  ORF g.146739 m.146739 type:complete len:232 (+) comp17263_c0_seq2:404-1099(+)
MCKLRVGFYFFFFFFLHTATDHARAQLAAQPTSSPPPPTVLVPGKQVRLTATLAAPLPMRIGLAQLVRNTVYEVRVSHSAAVPVSVEIQFETSRQVAPTPLGGDGDGRWTGRALLDTGKVVFEVDGQGCVVHAGARHGVVKGDGCDRVVWLDIALTARSVPAVGGTGYPRSVAVDVTLEQAVLGVAPRSVLPTLLALVVVMAAVLGVLLPRLRRLLAAVESEVRGAEGKAC